MTRLRQERRRARPQECRRNVWEAYPVPHPPQLLKGMSTGLRPIRAKKQMVWAFNIPGSGWWQFSEEMGEEFHLPPGRLPGPICSLCFIFPAQSSIAPWPCISMYMWQEWGVTFGLGVGSLCLYYQTGSSPGAKVAVCPSAWEFLKVGGYGFSKKWKFSESPQPE